MRGVKKFMIETQPWANAPVIEEGSSPWEYFKAEPGELDLVTPFNPANGTVLSGDKNALDQAVAKGGKLVYFQRPGGKHFVAVRK